MHVVVWDSLTTRNSVVLKYVEPHRVEGIVNGVRHSAYEACQRLSLALAEIQDRWGVASWDHKNSPLANLKGVYEGCSRFKSLNEHGLLRVATISGDLALQIFAERARLSLGQFYWHKGPAPTP